MICAILLLQGWFRMAWISIASRNWVAGRNVTMVQRYAISELLEKYMIVGR
jgi:hypothetical protein